MSGGKNGENKRIMNNTDGSTTPSPTQAENISDLRQEHDDVMRAIGHPPEGDGQEHSCIMDAIMGRDS